MFVALFFGVIGVIAISRRAPVLTQSKYIRLERK
jgi:hypothetical protein